MSSPRQNSEIQKLISLRKEANRLCIEFTDLDFRAERGWNSAEAEARLVVVSSEADSARAALRTHLRILQSDHAEVLAAYYAFEIEIAERELAKEPDDRRAQIRVEKWQKVASGESDDIIFVQILSENIWFQHSS